MSASIQQCRSCDAEIYWLLHSTTQRRAPIDATPSTQGTISVNLDTGRYDIVAVAERAAQSGHLRTNHFVTCPLRRQRVPLGQSAVKGSVTGGAQS